MPDTRLKKSEEKQVVVEVYQDIFTGCKCCGTNSFVSQRKKGKKIRKRRT